MLFGRSILKPLILVGAIGIPLVMWSESGKLDPRAWVESIKNGELFQSASLGTAENELGSSFANQVGGEPTMAGFGPPSEQLITPVNSPTDIFRFDVYPDWVRSQWPRVSTAPVLPDLYGMRVAVVTGTSPWDLHGSLTYYFDETQKVQKVSFVGNTTDVSRLISSLSAEYGFRQYEENSPGLYVAIKSGKPFGVIQFQYANVIRVKDSSNQVFVSIELNRPGSKFPLRYQFAKLSGVNR